MLQLAAVYGIYRLWSLVARLVPGEARARARAGAFVAVSALLCGIVLAVSYRPANPYRSFPRPCEVSQGSPHVARAVRDALASCKGIQAVAADAKTFAFVPNRYRRYRLDKLHLADAVVYAPDRLAPIVSRRELANALREADFQPPGARSGLVLRTRPGVDCPPLGAGGAGIDAEAARDQPLSRRRQRASPATSPAPGPSPSQAVRLAASAIRTATGGTKRMSIACVPGPV